MTEFAKSRVACLHSNVFYVPAYQLISVINVPTCLRVSVSFLRAKVPNGVPMFQLGVCQTACQFFNLGCQRARRRADFLNIPLNETREISILHYYIKKFYIILDIICICIVHRNCIILISILMSYQRKVWNFSFSFFLFCSLVRIENMKKTWFLYVTSNKGFLKFSTAKTVKQNKKYVLIL